jgi:endoglucanase
MTPTLGGPIDETFFARYNATVQAALASSPDARIIADLASAV